MDPGVSMFVYSITWLAVSWVYIFMRNAEEPAPDLASFEKDISKYAEEEKPAPKNPKKTTKKKSKKKQ